MSNSIAPGSSADVNVKVTALTTNPNVPVTYKTIILKKNLVNGVNTLTQEMMFATNTKYVIKYDYMLGENITVPAGCILEFDGGSIKNGNITLNDTFIFAVNTPIFDNIIFSGNISNDFFNALWVKGSDIGESINIAGTYFNKIKVPKNDYIFTTPIDVANAKYVEMLGTYSYQGSVSNNLSLITFRDTSAAIIRVGDITCYDIMANMDYRDNRTKNVIGVRFLNVVYSNLFVQKVAYLNEGIRICSDVTGGGGDNFIEGNRLLNNNIGVRIYQENLQSGGKSFVNDTRIKINYCNCTSNFQSTSYGVYLAGPNADPISYKTDAVDTYDRCNGIVIDGGDYELLNTIIYARNATFIIENCRGELITTLVKAVGRIRFSYKQKFENALGKLDLSECTSFGMFDYELPFKNDFEIKVLRFKNGSYTYVYPYNYYCLKPSGIDNTPSYGSAISMIGSIIENIEGKFILVKLDKPGRVSVGYLDANNNNVSGDYPAPNSQFSYRSADKYWNSGTDSRMAFIMIPTGVSRIIVGNVLVDSKFSVYSLGAAVDNNQVVRSGDTRPSALPSNEPFFDTTLGKPIFAKASASGSAVTWIDATGTTV